VSTAGASVLNDGGPGVGRLAGMSRDELFLRYYGYLPQRGKKNDDAKKNETGKYEDKVNARGKRGGGKKSSATREHGRVKSRRRRKYDASMYSLPDRTMRPGTSKSVLKSQRVDPRRTLMESQPGPGDYDVIRAMGHSSKFCGGFG
jgi:hypothetical protein